VQTRPYGIEDNAPMLAYWVKSQDKEVILFNKNLFTYAQLFCKILSMHINCKETENGLNIDIKSIKNKATKAVHSRFRDLFFHCINSSVPFYHTMENGKMSFAYQLCHVFETFISAHELGHSNFSHKMDMLSDEIKSNMNNLNLEYEQFEEIITDLIAVTLTFDFVAGKDDFVIYLGILLALEFIFLCSFWGSAVAENKEIGDVSFQKYRRDFFIYTFLQNKGDAINEFVQDVIMFFETLAMENLREIINAVRCFNESEEKEAFSNSDFYRDFVSINYDEEIKKREDYLLKSFAQQEKSGKRKEGVISTLIIKAKILLTNKDYEKALKSLTAALAVSEHIENGINFNAAICNFYIAKIHRVQNNLSECMNSLKKSYKIMNNIIDSLSAGENTKSVSYDGLILEAKIQFNTLNNEDLSSKGIDEAEKIMDRLLTYYEDCINKIENVPLSKEKKRILDDIAVKSVSEDDESYAKNIKLAKLYESILDDIENGNDLNNNLMLNEYNEEEKKLHIEIAKIKQRISENALDSVLGCFMLAKSSYEAKKYDEAINYYSIALYVLRESKDYDKITFVYKNVADVYLAKEEYGLAQEYFRKAISLALRFDVGKNTLIESYSGIAKTFIKYDDDENALKYYEKAIIESKNANESDFEAIVSMKLNYASFLRDKGFYSKALNLVKDAYNFMKTKSEYSQVSKELYEVLRNQYSEKNDVSAFDDWLSGVS